ncbi:MAG TPA: helix-turn-helix transcriptional regulator [Kineosporiaceae bacterium]|nr:helix-turn-helix transcriptional regulator [Kineosporiaceae bacterium]
MAELAGPDPTIHRRRLRSELRKAREAAGLTQRETAEAMDWSMSKLIRIETGDVRVSTNDLRAMLSYYTVDSERISALVDVAKAAREQPRWARYKDVASPAYLAFLGYESSATIIRNFEPTLVPGLLQTEEYAREVISAVESADRVDSLVDLRIERQEIIFRQPAPKLHFIIDESVIRHLVGGPDVMRRQLVQLRELAAQPHINLRILTFDKGIYPRMRIPYVIFEFDAPEDEDVLYIENATNELVIKENSPTDSEVDGPVGYLQSFWSLEQLAPREDAVHLLEDALARLAARQNGAS